MQNPERDREDDVDGSAGRVPEPERERHAELGGNGAHGFPSTVTFPVLDSAWIDHGASPAWVTPRTLPLPLLFAASTR